MPAVPPIDSVDVWPLVIGANTTSPRTVLPVDASTILVGRHKLIVTPGHTFVTAAGWTGPIYPNSTTAAANRSAAQVRLRCPPPGCLFDVVNDPTEHDDIAADQPALASQLMSTLVEERKRFWENHDKGTSACPRGWKNGWWGDGCACWMAAHVHGDNETGPWLGPFQE